MSLYFKLEFDCRSYPFTPPKLTAMSFIPHPCIDTASLDVCLYMLKRALPGTRYGGWSPAFSANSIIMQLRLFFDISVTDIVSEREMSLCRERLSLLENTLSEMKLQKLSYMKMYFQISTAQAQVDESSDDRENKSEKSTDCESVSVGSVSSSDEWQVVSSSSRKNSENTNKNIRKASNSSAHTTKSTAKTVTKKTARVAIDSSSTHSNSNRYSCLLQESLPVQSIPKQNKQPSKVTKNQQQQHQLQQQQQQQQPAKKLTSWCSSLQLSSSSSSKSSCMSAEAPMKTAAHLNLGYQVDSFNRQLWKDVFSPLLPSSARVEKMDSVNFLLPITETTSASNAHNTPNAQQAARHFSKLSDLLVYEIALLCTPREIISLLKTCKLVHGICMNSGYIWRELIQRHFPSCPVVPESIVASDKNTWHYIWSMKMNGVHYEELTCFCTKATMESEVLGIPIDYTINPKTRKVDYIYSTMELVSHRAWNSQNLSTTVWGETIKGWLPVYLCEEHFQRGAQLLPSCLRRIVNDPNTVDRHRPHQSSPSLAEMILEIYPKLMSTMVVLLVDNGVDEVEHTLKGYGMVHRMFLALANRVPGLRAAVTNKLQSFLRDDSMRNKSACPSLGEFMALLSVSPDIGWMDMVAPLMREGFSRSVLWICRDVPELASLPAMVKSNTDEAVVSEVIQKVFSATDNSRRIYSFHCCFLKLLATPRGIDTQAVSQRYDKTFGMMPLHVSKRLQVLLKEAVAFDGWQSFFMGVCLKPPSSETLVSMWVDAVQASLRKGYHSASTDFSKIQCRGVSNILLRGTSYGKVVLCIDVSGSMGMHINDPSGRTSGSRLDFVKQQLKEVFCSRYLPYNNTIKIYLFIQKHST